MIRRQPRSTRTDTLFPYTTLFRSIFDDKIIGGHIDPHAAIAQVQKSTIAQCHGRFRANPFAPLAGCAGRSASALECAAIYYRGGLSPCQSSEERRVGKEWFSTCRSRWSQDY